MVVAAADSLIVLHAAGPARKNYLFVVPVAVPICAVTVRDNKQCIVCIVTVWYCKVR